MVAPVEKPLPRIVDLRAAMRRNEDAHNIQVGDHYQLELSPDDCRLLWSCYQTGDVAQFSKIHFLARLEAFLAGA